MHAVDVMPTLLDAAGLLGDSGAPRGAPLIDASPFGAGGDFAWDGVSAWPMLRSGANASGRAEALLNFDAVLIRPLLPSG